VVVRDGCLPLTGVACSPAGCRGLRQATLRERNELLNPQTIGIAPEQGPSALVTAVCHAELC